MVALIGAILLQSMHQSAMAQSGVTGRVLDGSSAEPMPFTTVSLLQLPDSALAGGAVTDLEGEFVIHQSAGVYLLRISFMGYTDFFRKVEIEEAGVKDLKNLRIVADAKLLKEFKVEALQSSFKTDIDKRVFNVENSIVAEGGTAIDVLETLPSIQVGEQGGIRMRGSGEVLIYINGRPTNLSGDEAESILAQFPANAVKSVELITNPSSRYDAAGAGGIINIILRKEERKGFNGRANASAGTRHKYNSGVNMNYGKGRTNFFANYDFRYEERFSDNSTFRESFNPDFSRFLEQDYFTVRTSRAHLFRTGLDHDFSDRSTLSWYGQVNIGNDFRNRDYAQLLSSAEGLRDSLIDRNIFETNLRTNFETGLNYTLALDTQGTRLSTSLSYAYDDRDRLEVIRQNVSYSDDSELTSSRLLQNYFRPRRNELIQMQADLEKPFGNGFKLELGVKSTIEMENFPQVLEDFNFEEDFFVRDNEISNEVDFDRQVHAAYSIVRGNFGDLGFQLGLRAEQTYENVGDAQSGETVSKDYIDFFPSAYLSYTLTERSNLLVNYSRRINRPNLWRLAPLFNVQDPLNLRLGNPNLRPEYTDSYEAGVAQSFKGYFVTATVFHRRTADVMSRIFEEAGTNAAIMTWANVNTELATGLELINQFELDNWLDATFTANFFYNELQGGPENPDFDNSNFSWTLNLLTNLKLGSIGTAQIMANYRGPIVRPQGIVEPMYGINVGFRREVLRGKGTVSLNVTDIFNTRRFIIEVDDVSFSQRRVFDWETRIATLAFTYRFGGFKDRKAENGRGGDMNGGDDF